MTGNTKIKVRREDLIAAIKAKRDEERASHERLVVEAREAKRDYAERLAEFLEGVAQNLRASGSLRGIEQPGRYGARGIRLPNSPTLPEPLGKFQDRYANSIRQLEMCPDETITISADDFAAYLR